MGDFGGGVGGGPFISTCNAFTTDLTRCNFSCSRCSAVISCPVWGMGEAIEGEAIEGEPVVGEELSKGEAEGELPLEGEVGGGILSEVGGGTFSEVEGGTLSEVGGGTFSEVGGGTLSEVGGGTLSEVGGRMLSEVGGRMLSSCTCRAPRALRMFRRALHLARSFTSDIVISLVSVCTQPKMTVDNCE